MRHLNEAIDRKRIVTQQNDKAVIREPFFPSLRSFLQFERNVSFDKSAVIAGVEQVDNYRDLLVAIEE